jgi:hypothetical protein
VSFGLEQRLLYPAQDDDRLVRHEIRIERISAQRVGVAERCADDAVRQVADSGR